MKSSDGPGGKINKGKEKKTEGSHRTFEWVYWMILIERNQHHTTSKNNNTTLYQNTHQAKTMLTLRLFPALQWTNTFNPFKKQRSKNNIESLNFDSNNGESELSSIDIWRYCWIRPLSYSFDEEKKRKKKEEKEKENEKAEKRKELKKKN